MPYSVDMVHNMISRQGHFVSLFPFQNVLRNIIFTMFILFPATRVWFWAIDINIPITSKFTTFPCWAILPLTHMLTIAINTLLRLFLFVTTIPQQWFATNFTTANPRLKYPFSICLCLFPVNYFSTSLTILSIRMSVKFCTAMVTSFSHINHYNTISEQSKIRRCEIELCSRCSFA